jgi:PHD/YefM family antitoxin component YafN of YafNO toxin-antitoxin module
MTATEVRRKLYRLLDTLAESHEPIQIAGKRNSAVLISKEDWRVVQETLYLVGIPSMRNSIVKSLKTPVGKCDKTLAW